jgi:hypothetical protein
MPKRTAKINRSEDKAVEQETVEQKAVETEQVGEEDLQNEKKVDSLSLDNLRDLIFLGRLREHIDIAGFRFVVSTLTARQQREIMQQVMTFDQVNRILDIKPVTMSYAIETINGVPLEELCNDDDIEDTSERKLSVIYNMQASVVEKVYQVYEKLVQEANTEIGLEALKE